MILWTSASCYTTTIKTLKNLNHEIDFIEHSKIADQNQQDPNYEFKNYFPAYTKNLMCIMIICTPLECNRNK